MDVMEPIHFGMRPFTCISAILVLLSGCSNSTTAPHPHTSTTQAESDLQTRILEDGVVTHAEYEQAVVAYLTCVEDAGYAAQGPVWTQDREMIDYTIRVPFGDTARADTEMERCDTENLSRVREAWSLRFAITQEEFEEEVELYRQCLIAEGIEGIENMDMGEILNYGSSNIDSFWTICTDVMPGFHQGVSDLPEFNGPGAG